MQTAGVSCVARPGRLYPLAAQTAARADYLRKIDFRDIQ